MKRGEASGKRRGSVGRDGALAWGERSGGVVRLTLLRSPLILRLSKGSPFLERQAHHGAPLAKKR